MALPTTDPSVTNELWVSNNMVVTSGFTGVGGTAPSWTSASLTIGDSWTQDGTDPIEYRLADDGNSVWIRGKMTRATAADLAEDTTLFTMGAAFQPDQDTFLTAFLLRDTADPRRTGSVKVDSAGVVKIWQGGTSIVVFGINGIFPLR